MKTIKVNGTTINLSRDPEAQAIYDSAVVEFEEKSGSRPSNRTAAKTWDNDLNTHIAQALTELHSQRASASKNEVSEISTISEQDSEYEMTSMVPPMPSTATHRVVT